jgi:hypothetical protein
VALAGIPGVIISIDDVTGRCVVKLDRQDEPVKNAMYYDEEPMEVVGWLWQICWPDESRENAQSKP